MVLYFFLKLLDDKNMFVKGEVQFKDYIDNWIELNGYSWSMEQCVELQGVFGQKFNYVKFELFSFSKYFDMFIMWMLQFYVDGKVCKCVEFYFFEEFEGMVEVIGGIFKFIILFMDVCIFICKFKGSFDDKVVILEEEWEFDYGDFIFDYKNVGVMVLIEKFDDFEDIKMMSDVDGKFVVLIDGGVDVVGGCDFFVLLGSL